MTTGIIFRIIFFPPKIPPTIPPIVTMSNPRNLFPVTKFIVSFSIFHFNSTNNFLFHFQFFISIQRTIFFWPKRISIWPKRIRNFNIWPKRMSRFGQWPKGLAETTRDRGEPVSVPLALAFVVRIIAGVQISVTAWRISVSTDSSSSRIHKQER